MLPLNNTRNFADDEQNFDYVVAYHETPDPHLERDPLEMAERLHEHVQDFIKDGFRNHALKVGNTYKEAQEFGEWALDRIDLSEGEY